ncbi:MAG TPA: kynureninase [Roseiflexaceae bacterium]|nr:kynureninase [Roseiflexaceae bacterium]HMP40106.1 kynureninase [Roseiflexaceae bacterium]
MSIPTDFSYAQQLDAQDPLATYRSEFVEDPAGPIYMDGNSLGRLPHATADHVRAIVEQQWGHDLIRGWNYGWYEAPQRIGDKIGMLVGAAPGQVLACDSTSVNLYKLLMAALQLRPDRRTIVSDTLNFPSDLYIAQGCIAQLGGRHELCLVESHDSLSIAEQSLAEHINEQTAVVMLSHVAFKSGALYDMAAITARAHAAGALVLWDLSHSAGALPVALDACAADFAIGCCYKYLNGGPGAPAFLYVRRELQEAAISPIWGWFGQQQPFAFGLDYQPAAGLARFLAGTPPIISLLAIEPALDMLLRAGMPAIRQKSEQLTEYAIALADALLLGHGYSVGTPRDVAWRGSHVSVRHAEGYRINRALIEQLGVLPDFREPDNIRLGLSPLTTSFADVWQTVNRLRRVVAERVYEHYSDQRLAVT